ncbi:TAF1 transcription initiation factor TFIID subunit TAF1 [Peniophora sp. CONT]|nr:TAF1 transcription initiation factor TFIID subunit TAF1 [Peniophora sp. CONT]
MASEDETISALTGFSLDHVLSGLSLPSGSGLNSQLGIAGLTGVSSKQIYNDDWDGDGMVGAGQGEDWEDEIDREMLEEDEGGEDNLVKLERFSPGPEELRRRRVRIVKRRVPRPQTVYERFPGFERDKILDFTELFKGRAVQKSRVTKRPLYVESAHAKRRDVPRGFLDAVVGDAKKRAANDLAEELLSPGTIDNDLKSALEQSRGEADTLALDDRNFDLVLLSNWEDQIIMEPGQSVQPSADPARPADLMTPANQSLESGAWAQSIIWSPNAPFRDFTQLEFNFGEEQPQEERQTQETRPKKRLRMDNSQTKDKFNISNDHFYEVAKDGGRHRVRQTFGQLVVEHSYPAQKLQLPFFKTRLEKQEARSFHRPALQFPANIEVRFNKVRTAKKKKDKSGRKLGKGGNVGETLHRTGDLSLHDTSNFVLWEYSEEQPPIISNVGMGSVFVNYYRKKHAKDEHIPKSELGQPFVLEPEDDTPYMKFGNVDPGQTIPTLYNNLVRAPLFKHKPPSTDFLVIKNTVKNDTRYYIRDIKNMFTVGQTYPVTEVPGPHSRKYTNTVKYRLQVIAFKLLQKSVGERLKIGRLMKYFPDQNELQMRQRLKEFMEYHRRGPHQGFWRLRDNWSIPSEADMLKMVTPEQVVLAESMQVGQRQLQDAGYSGNVDSSGGDDDSNLSIDQQLAPWITTKNFMYATQSKAMLKLHGEGDPTGRGEGFSFIRVSMKDIFIKADEDYETKLAEAEKRPKSHHKYNVQEQQKVYKSEIDRIWKAQFRALSKREPPQLDRDDEAEEKRKKAAEAAIQAKQYGRQATPAGPSGSRAGSLERDGSLGPDGGRVLRIKRCIEGEWRTEIVREPAVIRAYLKRRQMIEEEETMADSLAPTGDAERDRRARKRLEEEIARMKKNQERRLHRKNAKIVKEGGTPMTLSRPIKPDTTRRCGHCGQMGHMKTNRKCPRWAEFNSGAPPPTPSSATAAAASATSPPPGGLGFGGFSAPAVPSPLATSPPLTGMD